MMNENEESSKKKKLGRLTERTNERGTSPKGMARETAQRRLSMTHTHVPSELFKIYRCNRVALQAEFH